MTANARQQADKTDPWLQQVQEHVESLRHGIVQIVIRGARIVQIRGSEQPPWDSAALSSAQPRSAESFVTEWADA